MASPMNRGENVEDGTNRNRLDRISSLPDELLGHMLSFLPTKCAVNSSVLSTRWRYLFTLTTCLSFDDKPCFGLRERNETIEATRRFKEFVDRVLDLHRISPIKKFSLICRQFNDYSDLSRWVDIALQKGVQELSYKLYCLPDNFFVSETLVSLEISCFNYKKIQVRISIHLPKLKILYLGSVVFLDFNSMERMLSSCESLEELTLKFVSCDIKGHTIYRTGRLKVLTVESCCFVLGTFEIDAPNLAYLTCCSNDGVKIVPSWKYSCSFVKAELTFKCNAYDDFITNENSVDYDRELLTAAADIVTKLSFEMDSLQVLLKLGDGEQMPDFLSLLMLRFDSFIPDSWICVTSLLDKCPRLETVVFGLGLHCCQCSGRHYWDHCFCGSPSPPDIRLVPFSCHAQQIEVHDFCGHEVPMSLMGHLLGSASVLKKLTVFVVCRFDPEEELKIGNDVLMLPRVSKDCRVEVKIGAEDIPGFYSMKLVGSPQQ